MELAPFINQDLVGVQDTLPSSTQGTKGDRPINHGTDGLPSSKFSFRDHGTVGRKVRIFQAESRGLYDNNNISDIYFTISCKL